MRKLGLALIAVAALVLAAAPAGAVITTTAHELSAGCGACHIPHGAAGARLWVAPAVTGTTVIGAVSPLCAYCHISGGGAGLTNAQPYTSTVPTVYGPASHGVLMNATSNMPASTAPTTSGLPYTGTAGVFECSTCHDVHSDGTTGGGGTRPFLRDSVNGICARCHTTRHYVGGALSQGGAVVPGAWGTAQAGTGNPGSHPVGSDVTSGDFAGTAGNSPVTIPAIMRATTNATAGGWSLGGHLYSGASTGGVTCVTCHVVHGVEFDAQDPNAANLGGSHALDEQPNASFLALAQLGSTLGGRTVANGLGGRNVLCEGCHGGTNVGSAIYRSGGTFAVNPGNQASFTHPVDDYDAAYNAGITAFPTNWPVGVTYGTNVNMAPTAICESCHAPHPAASIAASRGDVVAGAGAYILRASMATVCNQCHGVGTSIAGHHPVGMTYSAIGATYLSGPSSAGGTQTLGCNTCHGGAAGGAHNWTLAHSPGVVAGWKPANNGRSATQATDMFNADMSKTCMDCHYFMTGAGLVNPTLGTNTHMFDNVAEPEYQETGLGTHYVGLIHNAATNWKGDGTTSNGNTWTAPLVNIYSTSTTWNGQTASSGFANGWSRFGGTSSTDAVLVCESCHSIRPSRNTGTHLLLGTYREAADANTDGGVGTPAGSDTFCMACHGIPVGTHQMTGMIISKTGVALATQGTKAWMRGSPTAAPLGDASYSGTNMSCDGCHQTHDANTNSATFILDAPASITLGTFTGAPVATGTLETTNPAATTAYPTFSSSTTPSSSAGSYATPTLTGRGGAVTGFCDQCHTYAY